MTIANNPIATPEQHEHELLALEVFNSAEIRETVNGVREYWLDLAQPSPAMRSCFDAAFEEVMFGAVVWALNQDDFGIKTNPLNLSGDVDVTVWVEPELTDTVVEMSRG